MPYELGGIETLRQLLLDGNPLKTIRVDIVKRGTEAIKKHLRNYLEPAETGADSSATAATVAAGLDQLDLAKTVELAKTSRLLDLSGKRLAEFSADMIFTCRSSSASVLNLSKNQLSTLSPDVELLGDQLRELIISFNAFRTLPDSACTLRNVRRLDVRNNQLSSLPAAFVNLTQLRELVIANNK